ncbi:GNAT family N-acetyltransferase [Phenylobacterium terrae]|uniref:GNAT family N-acetyltransferase n=1 Tax=Phenylobacterium terrae TaxID=2665495 RepID=A0ABW4N6C7_9CAUL
MGDLELSAIRLRPMGLEDLGQAPLDCHGGAAEAADRIRDLGAAAILAFDGDQHVGQLQFRRHRPGLRSAAGLFSPDYWGDFAGRDPPLPAATLCIYCYHVGQLTAGKDRDARYQGRGLGVALLDHLIHWARSEGFAAIVAKSMPPAREILQFMGGQTEATYASRGFTCVDRWIDQPMHQALVERDLVGAQGDPEKDATVGLCVLQLRP